MTRSPTRAVPPSPSRPPRPALSIVAAGVALALGTFGMDAAALSLGRLNVLSSLGEPLRAEVELSDLTAAEADGLRVRIPSAEAFRAIGVPYNAALADVQAIVQRRANGRYVVQLSSSRQMADPFIDVLLEANGSSGRVFRDYTVLIDPPGARPMAAAPAMAPVPVPRSAAVPGGDRASPYASESRPRPASAPAPLRRPVAVAPAAPVERIAPSAARSAGGGERRVTVRPGDTASRIANAVRPAEISLDQMLVALLRANPDAFMEGNLNRVRAGAVMEVPDATQAGALSPQDARRAVIAQSRDFGDYRRQLADNAPVAGTAQAGRQSSGRLQSGVETRTPNAPADRLTVAPGGVATAPANATAPQTGAGGTAASPSGTTAANGAPAGSAGAGASSATAAASAPASGPASTSVAAPPAAVVASGAGVVASVGSPVAVAVPPSPAASDAAGTGPAPASAPRTAAPTVRAPAPVAPEPEEAWYDAILTNPMALGGLGLIGLLIAWLALRLNGRRRRDAADSVFLESKVPKDSFFAASGGESVDTRNRGGALASSLSYSPSHVDAADVDPVAEADVYLAYGRDLQAEEILREALKANPERVAIHVKLLEIHAKRRDVRAYEGLAHDVRALTGGTGNEWARVVEMGRELDPGNPAYETGGRSASLATAAIAATATAEAIRAPAAPVPAPSPAPEPVSALPPVFTSQAPAFVPSVAPLDFDLDLDRPDPVPRPVAAPTATAPASQNPVAPPRPPLDTTMPMPLEMSREPPARPQNPFLSTMPHPPYDGGAEQPLTIDLADFDTAPAELETPPARPSPPDEPVSEYATLRADLPEDSGLIDFDVRDLSQARTPAAADTVRAGFDEQRQIDGNPQSIKLSLARELHAMGDIEGARSLIEEVETESSGDLRQQARRMLSQLV